MISRMHEVQDAARLAMADVRAVMPRRSVARKQTFPVPAIAIAGLVVLGAAIIALFI